MASPSISPHRAPVERSWMGMAMLAGIPLLSLILIRMLWSGSSLWFLTVGIILLGVAAVIFLARRPPQLGYSRQTLPQQTNRMPLILTALGVVFLAMLLLPNFSGGGSGPKQATQQQPSGAMISEVSGAGQPSVQQPPVEEQSEPFALEGAQTYVVQSGDTLWDIAQRFGVTVGAIVEANDLENPADLTLDQELIIPAPEAEATLTE